MEIKEVIKDALELKKKINALIVEAKMDEANSTTHGDRMFHIGKQNGLLWALQLIINATEFEDK